MLTIRTINESSQFLFDVPLSDESDEIMSIKNAEDESDLDETDETKLLKADKEWIQEKREKSGKSIDYFSRDLDILIKQSISNDEEVNQLLETYLRDFLQIKLFV
jgi:hypothetical protein